MVVFASDLPASAAPSRQPVRVEGIYQIVSTDCYFAGGRCRARFDIVQKVDRLSDPTDSLFHGRVHGDHVVVGERFPPGTSEDGWTASGTTSDGGRTVSGIFTDGIGGSGTFTMTRLAPR